MIQSEMLAMVRLRLDEALPGVGWSDAEIRGYINEGFRDIARRTETIERTQTISVSAGVQEHTLPADMIRLHRVEWKPTGQSQVYPVEYHDFQNMDAVWWTGKETASGTPTLCTMWGYPPSLKLILYPRPQLAGTLNVYYYSVPTGLATDGTDAAVTIPVPTGWEDLVAEYATYLAFRKDQNPRWQEARLAYEDNVTRMIDLTRRWSDQPGGGISNSMGGLPAWLAGMDEDW